MSQQVPCSCALLATSTCNADHADTPATNETDELQKKRTANGQQTDSTRKETDTQETDKKDTQRVTTDKETTRKKRTQDSTHQTPQTHAAKTKRLTTMQKKRTSTNEETDKKNGQKRNGQKTDKPNTRKIWESQGTLATECSKTWRLPVVETQWSTAKCNCKPVCMKHDRSGKTLATVTTLCMRIDAV